MELFSLVGGKSAFMKACGANEGVSDVFSKKGQQALQVC